MCVQCTVPFETVIGVCIAQCRLKLLFVCLHCTVQSETVTGVCRVHCDV